MDMKKLVVLGLTLLVILTVLSSCNSKSEDIDYSVHFEEETFMSNWEAWNKQNIKNYTFTMIKGSKKNTDLLNSRSTGSAPPLKPVEKWKFIVKNGNVDSFEYNDEVSQSINMPKANTISKIYQDVYDYAQQMKKYGAGAMKNIWFNIEFDSSFNYIKFYHFCNKKCESYCNLSDVGNTFIISEFTILD